MMDVGKNSTSCVVGWTGWDMYAYNINMYVYKKIPSSLEFERVVLPTEHEKVKKNPSETFFQIKNGKNLGQSSSS